MKEMREAMRAHLRVLSSSDYNPDKVEIAPVLDYRDLLLEVDNYDVDNPPPPDDADFAPAPLAPPPQPIRERKRGRPRKPRVLEYARPMEELVAARAAQLQAATGEGQRTAPPKDDDDE